MGKKNLSAEEKRKSRKRRETEILNNESSDNENVTAFIDRMFNKLHVDKEFKEHFFSLLDYVLDYFLEEEYDNDTFFLTCNKDLEICVNYIINCNNKDEKEFLSELTMAVLQRIKIMSKEMIFGSENIRVALLGNSAALENDLEVVCNEHDLKLQGIKPSNFMI